MFWDKKIRLNAHQTSVLMEDNSFTPDIAVLEEYKMQLLFVADEMMRDRELSNVLPDLGGIHQCVGFTMRPYRYLIWEGFFIPDYKPLLIECRKKDGGYVDTGWKVKGEVVAVPSSAFTKLDKLKKNMYDVVRKRTYIIYPHREWKVLENVCDDGSVMGHDEQVWNGKFPDGHPLGGKKLWIGPEKVNLLSTHIYVAHDKWRKECVKNPMMFSEVPRFTPNIEKRWLSEYYKYQRQRKD